MKFWFDTYYYFSFVSKFLFLWHFDKLPWNSCTSFYVYFYICVNTLNLYCSMNEIKWKHRIIDFIWTLGFFSSHLIAWLSVAHIFPLFIILYVTYTSVIRNSFCSQPSTFDIVFQVVHILIVLISSSEDFLLWVFILFWIWISYCHNNDMFL